MSFLNPDEAPLRMPVVDRSSGLLTPEWENWYQRGKGIDWDDLRFPATGLTLTGAGGAAATVDNSSTFAGTLLFSATVTNTVVGIGQMPHSWKLRTDISPHIHWAPTNTNTGNVAWQFWYQIAQINGTFPASLTTAGIEVDAADGTTNKHQIHSFTDIDMSGIDDVSAIIVWKVSRIGGDASDTYNAQARLLEVDFHYEIDRPGSRKIGSK